MERRSKLKLPMVLLHGITVFTRRVVKPVQTALPQSLHGQEDLHTGMTVFSSISLRCIGSRFIHYLGLQIALYTYLFHVCFRAKLDDNARLLDFTQKLEAACIGAVESGKMTKDLALLVHGSSKYVVALSVLYPIHNTCISDFVLTDFCCSVTRSHYLNTEEFIDAVADELRSRLAANSNL